MATFPPKQLIAILSIIPALLLSACQTSQPWAIHSIYVESRHPVVRAAAEERLNGKGYSSKEDRGAASAVLEIADPTGTHNQNVYYADLSMRLLGPPNQRQLYWSCQTQGAGSTPAEALQDAVSMAIDGTHLPSVDGLLKTVIGVLTGTSFNRNSLPACTYYPPPGTPNEEQAR